MTSDFVTGRRPGHFGTQRRRRRLPPAFTQCFKELGELLVHWVHARPGSHQTDGFERALILWWIKWCVMEERNGKPTTDTQGTLAIPQEAEAGQVDGIDSGGKR